MALNHRRTVLVALLALSMVLAGCTGAGGGGGTVQSGGDGGEDVGYAGSGGGGDAAVERTVVAEATQTPMATPAPEAETGGGDGGAGGGERAAVGESEVVLQREAIIRTGQVRLEVESYDGAVRNLSMAIRDRGGYISDSQEELHRIDNKTWTTGRLVLRVPRQNFSSMMDRVQREGTVLEAQTNSQDVTDQLVDIRARLDNLRAQRDQLRELYQRANTTEDILAVQRRLTDVQTEIERLEARQKTLRQRVAYSTITVYLQEPRPEPDPPDVDRWYDTPMVEAFLESVNGVVVTVRALGVFLAYALPYIVVFALPLVVIGGVYWRRRNGGSGGGLISEPDGEETEETAADDEATAGDAESAGAESDDGGDGEGTDGSTDDASNPDGA